MLVAELCDPRIGFATLTRVEVSSDLRNARVFVSILGTTAQQRTALRGLESARKRIRRTLGERLTLRRVPEVSFRLDPGVKRSVRMTSLLSALEEEREAADPAAKRDDVEDGGLSEEPESDVR